VRAALILAIVAAASVVTASVATAAPRKGKAKPARPAQTQPAAEEPPAPPPAPKPIAPAAKAVLDRIVTGDAAARKAAIDELFTLAPTIIEDLGHYVTRLHDVTVEDRRKVLQEIRATVPDDKGRFIAPPRRSAKEEKADDDLDWLAALLALDAGTPGLGEVIADVAALRALSATRDVTAGKVLFDAAFQDESMVYRDEIGRYLRKMEPYCIPALFREATARSFDRRRYSNYQLERLDRQEPGKALGAAAGDEALTIAILDVWRQTKHREAVHAVWGKVNADSPRVRAMARETWRAYIEGPPPRPAPKKKLQLPGGRLTKKEKPLWLTYRELADNELRKQSNELLGTDYLIVDPTLDDRDDRRAPKPQTIDLSAVTQELFAHYDKLRAEQQAKEWQAAEAKASSGELVAATTMLDRLLAANPDHQNRAQMAPVYLAFGKELEAKQQWDAAAAAYSKAHGVAPEGPNAVEALASHHFMLGKALEAAGKDGGPDYRKAFALRPDFAPAKEAAVRASGGKRPLWMLYAAACAAIVALGLFAAAVVRRRA
jgi:tetratricopeptide (TPR) repeat protein